MSSLTEDERAILEAFTDGEPVHRIAADHRLPVKDMRDILWRLCRLQDRIARIVLAEDRVSTDEPEPEPPPIPPAPDDRLPAVLDDELIAAGLTYRQLDYWFRTGLIHAVGGNTPGSGYSRKWTEAERSVALTMIRLIKAGIGPHTAVKVARGQAEIAPGIRVVVEAREEAQSA